MRLVFFFMLLAATAAYALARGGGPERATALALVAASMLTQLLRPATHFLVLQRGVLAVDLLLLLVLVAIALYGDRFWTLWSAALHALGIAGHLVKLIDGAIIPFAYAILLIVWSYPMIGLLIVGTFRHSRRQRALGTDLDWSFRD